MSLLGSSWLGLDLRTPIVAAASPLSATLDGIRRLEEAGAAAIVLPSLFEEQVTHESLQVHGVLTAGAESFQEVTGGYFPDLDDYNTGPDRYLDLIRDAKASVGVPIIASLNCTSTGEWVRYAGLVEEAGADALEMNIGAVVSDPDLVAAEVEERHAEVISAVREAIALPLGCKIGPYFTALVDTARRLADAGADGLVLFNRFYHPDIDLDTLRVRPRLRLSTPHELHLPLRWIGILRGRVDVGLAATSGVHGAEDALKALLAGADIVMIASVLIREGLGRLAKMEGDMALWLEEREYESVAQLRGSISQRSSLDPAAFERSNYLTALVSYSSSFRG